MTLELVPVSYEDACAFVEAWHRHNAPPPGHKFSIGAAQDGVLVGVVMVGRPVRPSWNARGARNANSLLYGAAWRAAKALGYRRLITYTQAAESGSSLHAAGYQVIAERPPRPGWNVPSRPRDGSSYLSTTRYLWEAT